MTDLELVKAVLYRFDYRFDLLEPTEIDKKLEPRSYIVINIRTYIPRYSMFRIIFDRDGECVCVETGAE